MKFVPEEFQIPFYKISCCNWIHKKNKLRVLIENNINSFTNNDLISKVNTTFLNGNFKNEICEITSDEIKTFEQISNLQVESKEAWFQVYNYMENHGAHNHGLGYSCVLFINFVKGVHQPTHFLTPFVDCTHAANNIYIPDVDEGDFLFFPSTITHYVPSNRSQTSRIIASINFLIKS